MTRSRRARALQNACLWSLAAQLSLAVAAWAAAGPTETSAETGSAAQEAAAAVGPERVVLLHGLLREPRAMKPIARRLSDEGYEVHNLGYPSTDESPEQLVGRIGASVDACCRTATTPLHFVTHSLGGVVARAYLAAQPPSNLGRVVMLAPPSQGSELVDRFGDDWWFRGLLGPTAADLGSHADSFPNRIPPPTYPLGIIAGRHAFASLIGGRVLGENDGVVSVESTRVTGMTDFLIVRSGHVQIRRNDEVADETVHFLRYGRFRSTTPSETGEPENPGPSAADAAEEARR